MIFRLLFSLRFWITITVIGLCVQTTGFVLFGLQSINHVTPLVFYSALWLIFLFLIRRRHSKDTDKRKNYTVLCTTVFITLSLAEILLRTFSFVSTHTENGITGYYQSPYNLPDKGFWINKRSHDVSFDKPEFTFFRKLNSEGFSDRDWDMEKMKDKIRILTLGDSFTEGDGAHEDSTWQRFLERKMNDSSVVIMNAGICGSDPVYEYHLYENRLLKYQPHLVIVCINKSDIFDIAIRGGFERFRGNEVFFNAGPWWESIFAVSHISRLFFRIRYDKNLLDKSKQGDYLYHSSIVIADAMNRFVTLAERHSAHVLFVFHPGPGELMADYFFMDPLVTAAGNKSLDVCNLFTYYREEGVCENISRYFWPEDSHHNAAGYSKMADGIWKVISEKKLPGSGSNTQQNGHE
jgi:lysophospholipase L1-like esterase